MKAYNFLIQAQEAENSQISRNKKLLEYIKLHSLDIKVDTYHMEITIGKISDEHLKNILAMV